MSYLLTIAAILLAFSHSFSQSTTDYQLIRPSLIPGLCGDLDSLTLTEVKSKLEAFDTTTVTHNLQGYYEDMGIVYYSLYLYSYDTTLIRDAITVYNKALFHDPKSHSALWNKIYAYYILGDCANVLRSVESFKSRIKRRYWDQKELKPLVKRCEGE